MNAVIFTTTCFRARLHRLREKLALRMISSAAKEGFVVVVLDCGSKRSGALRKAGAIVYHQGDLCSDPDDCMGKARRKALQHALAHTESQADILIWTEPEKINLVPVLRRAVRKIETDQADVLMFNRRSLDSYPPEQAVAYGTAAGVASAILKRDLDFMFGPVMFRRRVARYWLNYRGEHGDKWDSIHIPKLRALMGGVPATTLEIDYSNPEEQTRDEAKDLKLVTKRIEQAHSTIIAVVKETQGARRVLLRRIRVPKSQRFRFLAKEHR